MKKGDIVIIILVLVITLTTSFYKLYVGLTAASKKMIVKKDTKVQHELTLTDKTDEVFRVEEDGAYNIIVVKNGVVYIQEANCYNQVCVHDGQIDKAGEILVCLPHKVTVEIVGSQKEEWDILSE